MRKFLALLAIAPLLSCGGGPKDPVREVAASSEAYSTLHKLCKQVGHRLSGTENGRKAEEFAIACFKDYGLSDVKAEPFEHLGWTRGAASMLVLDPRRKVDAVALGNTPGANVEAEIVSCGYGSPEEFARAGASIKGKIVLVTSEAPSGQREVHRIEKMAMCARGGAAAMILVARSPGNIIQTGTVAIGKLAPIAAAGITREEGDILHKLLKEGRTLRAQLSVATTHGPTSARNVSAQIRGSMQNEMVVVGAHLDSWDLSEGAIDNGTGVAVLLETARALVLAERPRRTIRFVLFMGEELGLYGSKAYVKAHEKELGQMIMMINMDMVGKPLGFHLYGCDEARDFFKAQTDWQGLVKPVECKAGLHSDHQPFMLAGVPSMTISSQLEEQQLAYYHSKGDHFGLAKRDQLEAAARALAQTVLAVANCDTRPAPWLTKDETRNRMVRDGVREALELTGEWPY